MRKQYKKKLRSCAMCKPHKMAKAKRWKPDDEQGLRDAEREMREVVRHGH